ncbi:hypothetical protein [Exiguobacterium sp. OS-77]|uniref:hypothetical protein n=1 Tax=Exiguobacterium sp. OS-77 TaxID=1241306 RepID=UPI000429B5EB|nr:hypothetical protein [Exiguobacterium sp. OS-77]
MKSNELSYGRGSKILINKLIKCTAIMIWIYVIIKLFFFDIDVYIIKKFAPEKINYINYKFLFIISLVALLFIFKKNKAFIILLYIAFFPLILVTWEIPYFIFKQKSWVLAIACINSFITIIISLKQLIVMLSVYLISVFIVINTNNKYAILVVLITLCCFFLYAISKRIIMIFKSSKINDFYRNIILQPFTDNLRKQIALDHTIKNIPFENLDENQKSKWVEKLQTTVLYNRLYIFMSKKLKNYQESKLSYAYYAFSIISLIFLVIVTFSIINLGVYKIDKNAFKLTGSSSFFTFFYYSFNNIVINGIDEIKPQNMISKTLYMFEVSIAMVISMIFVTLMFSAKNEKNNQELDRIITKFEDRGNELELMIKEDYDLNTIDEALEKLETLKSVIIGFIYRITDRF